MEGFKSAGKVPRYWFLRKLWYIYCTLSDWELSCEYGDQMWIIGRHDSVVNGTGFGMQNMNHPWWLEVLRNIAWPLCVVPRSVCARAVSCAITRRLCCLPCPNCWLYISYRDACLLCCAMLSSYVMVLTLRLIFAVCLVLLIVFKTGLCLVIFLVFSYFYGVGFVRLCL